MPKQSNHSVLYVKLGPSGEWAPECIEKGIIKFGYNEVSHSDCSSGRWDRVENQLEKIRSDKGTIKRDLNQTMAFYKSDKNMIWVTFHGDMLWWCKSGAKVMAIPGGFKVRKTIGSWKCTDISGENKLSKDKLIGSVLSIEGFRGTICSVKESEYLINKINGETPPEIEEASTAYQGLVGKIEVLIRKLHWQDFEDLIDLIFREGGWKRTGDRRKTQETIDLLLVSPVTREKISVQVKSKAAWTEFLDYKKRFSEIQDSSRFFFVVHTPDPKLERELVNSNLGESVTYWGPKDIARLCVDYGLSEWVMQKVS